LSHTIEKQGRHGAAIAVAKCGDEESEPPIRPAPQAKPPEEYQAPRPTNPPVKTHAPMKVDHEDAAQPSGREVASAADMYLENRRAAEAFKQRHMDAMRAEAALPWREQDGLGGGRVVIQRRKQEPSPHGSTAMIEYQRNRQAALAIKRRIEDDLPDKRSHQGAESHSLGHECKQTNAMMLDSATPRGDTVALRTQEGAPTGDGFTWSGNKPAARQASSEDTTQADTRALVLAAGEESRRQERQRREEAFAEAAAKQLEEMRAFQKRLEDRRQQEALQADARAQMKDTDGQREGKSAMLIESHPNASVEWIGVEAGKKTHGQGDRHFDEETDAAVSWMGAAGCAFAESQSDAHEDKFSGPQGNGIIIIAPPRARRHPHAGSQRAAHRADEEDASKWSDSESSRPQAVGSDGGLRRRRRWDTTSRAVPFRDSSKPRGHQESGGVRRRLSDRQAHMERRVSDETRRNASSGANRPGGRRAPQILSAQAQDWPQRPCGKSEPRRQSRADRHSTALQTGAPTGKQVDSQAYHEPHPKAHPQTHAQASAHEVEPARVRGRSRGRSRAHQQREVAEAKDRPESKWDDEQPKAHGNPSLRRRQEHDGWRAEHDDWQAASQSNTNAPAVRPALARDQPHRRQNAGNQLNDVMSKIGEVQLMVKQQFGAHQPHAQETQGHPRASHDRHESQKACLEPTGRVARRKSSRPIRAVDAEPRGASEGESDDARPVTPHTNEVDSRGDSLDAFLPPGRRAPRPLSNKQAREPFPSSFMHPKEQPHHRGSPGTQTDKREVPDSEGAKPRSRPTSSPIGPRKSLSAGSGNQGLHAPSNAEPQSQRHGYNGQLPPGCGVSAFQGGVGDHGEADTGDGGHWGQAHEDSHQENSMVELGSILESSLEGMKTFESILQSHGK